MKRLPCNECKEGTCKVKAKCGLFIPLGMIAATINPVGLITAMDKAGFRFDNRSDSFRSK